MVLNILAVVFLCISMAFMVRAWEIKQDNSLIGYCFPSCNEWKTNALMSLFSMVLAILFKLI